MPSSLYMEGVCMEERQSKPRASSKGALPSKWGVTHQRRKKLIGKVTSNLVKWLHG